ncbi:peptidoglycan-binding protein [Phytoactinopolyspora alkaliphila]|uniref:Peptidoglycan-binding protein n=1 Tax=Phytoactinopolyspora alkaliphila TaxID=1783498 RepID=A0A6N9YJW0_9ACTN|nr:peptidoglycan-binding domain-containing protein [Phytoactinopolyspora alkaliphila]NED95169.1 peptidoglycan-binding protein [Phytoactinopolyspora alkaliphila]
MAIHATAVIPGERRAATSRPRRLTDVLSARAAWAARRVRFRLDRLLVRIPEVDADPASVQRILVEIGRLEARYATGRWHPRATRALTSFQRELGLRTDGVADRATVHALARAWHSSSRWGVS